MMDGQWNDKNNKDNKTNNDTQNTTQKTKDWATRTTLNTQDKQHKILHRKLKIGQHEPHLVFCVVYPGFLVWFVLPNL
jgi:hypothetical protein